MKKTVKKNFLSMLGLVCALSVPLSASAYVLGPTTPGKWGPATMGTGATVSWSLMGSGTSCAGEASGCTITALAAFMPAGFLGTIQNAFAAWSAAADIHFVMMADDGAAYNTPTASGDIRLGGHTMDGLSGTLAHGYFAPINGGSAAGDIHFDTAEPWNLGFAGAGFDVFQVMAHEIGHAIGLHHTNVANSLMNPHYTEAFSGPQADDIAGARFIYGAPVQVPEPASMALLGLALAGLGLSRRRAAR